eukprot:10927261-Alexandrium_andersonii.AAC.1
MCRKGRLVLSWALNPRWWARPEAQNSEAETPRIVRYLQLPARDAPVTLDSIAEKGQLSAFGAFSLQALSDAF